MGPEFYSENAHVVHMIEQSITSQAKAPPQQTGRTPVPSQIPPGSESTLPGGFALASIPEVWSLSTGPTAIGEAFAGAVSSIGSTVTVKTTPRVVNFTLDNFSAFHEEEKTKLDLYRLALRDGDVILRPSMLPKK